MSEYHRIRRLRAGGQGVVWEGAATDGRQVALKYMTANAGKPVDANNLARFGREVQYQAELDHDGIMPILFADLNPAEPYFVMPWAEYSLLEVLNRKEPMETESALAIFESVVDAVAFAHGHRIIHRDLKPDNILFLDGRPVVSDFGLGLSMYTDTSRVTRTNAMLGTWGWSAPEQFRDAASVDMRADVYALGVILFQMLSSERPTSFSLNLSSVPELYRLIILKCTNVEPSLRYPSAQEIQADLVRLRMRTALENDPARAAERMMRSAGNPDEFSADDYLDIFVRNPDDRELYLRYLPRTSVESLVVLAANAAAPYDYVFKRFFTFANAKFAPEFVDHLSYFILKVAQTSPTEELVINAMAALAGLAINNDRAYAARRLVELFAVSRDNGTSAAQLAGVILSHPTLAPMIAPDLRAMPDLPALVDGALRARGN